MHLPWWSVMMTAPRRGFAIGLVMLGQLPGWGPPAQALRPGDFPELPAAIRDEWQAAGCRVPQPSFPKERANVISGEFVAAGQTDWAAMCWSKDRLGLRVHFASETGCAARFRAGLSIPGLPVTYDDSSISRATPAQMRDTAKRHQGPKDFAFEHDGIVVGNEKAAMTYYCYRGRWMVFLSAD